MPTTLGDLRSEVLDELKIDPNMKVNSPTLLNRNINRAVRKIQQDVTYSMPENVKVVVLAVGTQEVNLPERFIKIANPNGVKIGTSTPLYPADYVQLLGAFDLTVNTGQPYQYYVRKTSATQYVMGFFPSPTQNYSVTVPYYEKLQEMAVNTDESPLPDIYDEAIVYYAVFATLKRIKGFEAKAKEYYQYYKDELQSVQASAQVPDQYSLQVGHQRLPDNYYVSPKAFGGDFYGV